ncbi:MAG: hypothetical protein ABJN62_07605 [Halioglobus sp.]
MKKIFIVCMSLLAFTVGTALADTLELADGRLLEGDFVGSSNGIVMFDTGDGIEAFPEDQVVGVFFSSGVATAETVRTQEPATVTVPEGTRLVIRTSDSVDTRRHSAGHRFRGQLESALVVDGITVARRGTTVHGRIVQARQSGRLAGSSELAMEFTDIMVNDQLFEMRTGGLQAQGQNEAGRTIGRTARAAAIGGLASGSSGARTGARVGAGASLLTSGSSINIPAGTILETNLASALSLPRP